MQKGRALSSEGRPSFAPIKLVPEKSEQNDDRNGNAEQPEQNSSTHDDLSFQSVRGESTRSFQVPSRSWPPSTAARLAANAPSSSEAVSQSENCAAALRVLSAAALASVTTSLTRFSASA